MSAQYMYLVRCRDVLTGKERWLSDDAGQPIQFSDRQSADVAALLANGRSSAWEYASAAEIDLASETFVE